MLLPPFSVGADCIFARRRLSDRLPPGWEQGAVASPQRPAPQGCLKEKAQSKEDISVPTEENRGKHLIKGKSLLSYPPAPSTASRSPSLPEGGRKECPSVCLLLVGENIILPRCSATFFCFLLCRRSLPEKMIHTLHEKFLRGGVGEGLFSKRPHPHHIIDFMLLLGINCL